MPNSYQPSYNTEIATKTVVQQLPTMHLDHIDWNFPFYAPSNSSYYTGEQREQALQKHIKRLKICEQPNAWASYPGQLYLYRVLKVGMASCAPFWKPRPTVLLWEPTGVMWVDWTRLVEAVTR